MLSLVSLCALRAVLRAVAEVRRVPVQMRLVVLELRCCCPVNPGSSLE
ncbi:MAG TPA: hypothetical protein VD838_21185 [Anaeromyxobacteraceae bacterium]|nr:hypothetical protein [Anaeromyxobacteraceae bacterium]